MFIEFCTVKIIGHQESDIVTITPFCYKFIQLIACKNWHTRPQLVKLLQNQKGCNF